MEENEDEFEESFPDDLDPYVDKDTTAAQFKAGRDQQGIPWSRLNFNREAYREQRNYQNYTNVLDMANYDNLQDFHKKELGDECTSTTARGDMLSFYRNFRDVQSTIIHFQLRNLVWAASSHDLYVVHNNCIKHWNMVTRRTRTVLDLTGGSPASRDLASLGLVYVSTCCVNGGIVAAGGFSGELVVASDNGDCVLMSKRISECENSITNSIELSTGVAGAWRLLSANNDDTVRLLDVATCTVVSTIPLGWAANYSTANPVHRGLVAVVGDDQNAFLHDTATTKSVATLSGHRDYSFAAAWHPNGVVLATGNQDCTTRVWDIRQTDRSLVTLPGVHGSVRSCRFSRDGRWLAVAEPADFAHVYSVASGLLERQTIDLFGEISGIAFSPDSDSFFVGVPDQVYNSLLCYRMGGAEAWTPRRPPAAAPADAA